MAYTSFGFVRFHREFEILHFAFTPPSCGEAQAFVSTNTEVESGAAAIPNFAFCILHFAFALRALRHRDVRSKKRYVILSEVELLRAARAASKKRYRKQNINVYMKH